MGMNKEIRPNGNKKGGNLMVGRHTSIRLNMNNITAFCFLR